MKTLHSVSLFIFLSQRLTMHRRLLFGSNRQSSVASSTTTNSVPNSLDDEEHIMTSDLQDKIARAEDVHCQKDFANLVGIAESPRVPYLRDGQAQWKRVERSHTFTLLTRKNEVLALARLDASMEEVASVLATTTDHLHTVNMKGLYRDAFIAGSVVFAPQVQVKEAQVNQFLTVKTCCFVHSELLGKNEQWSYAEKFHRGTGGDRFKLTQVSLSATTLPAVNANSRRVAQLQGVTIAYLVERMPGSHGLRVVFHALYEPTEVEHGTPTVPRTAVNLRLRCLARGIAQLSQLVRSRRFGLQLLANHSAFEVRNPRCTCCTRRFTLFIPRTRCSLCGYYVCMACLSSEKMEAQNCRLAAIMVCNRCVKSVDACDYKQILTVLPGPARVLSDESFTSNYHPDLSPSSSNSEVLTASANSSSSQKLADLLVDDNSETSGAKRLHTAQKVLEQLLLVDKDDNQGIYKNESISSLETSISRAKKAMDISHYPVDVTACKFASSKTRPYPLIPALIPDENDSNNPKELLTFPIPANEKLRLAAINHFSLHELCNIPELNVICELAAVEMGCPHSVITLVEQKGVKVLAANSAQDWDSGGNPRGETFCQHFVMDDQPLLVRHAEADMRFYHTGQVVHRGLRFYAGFPVSLSFETIDESSSIIVGALCCLDEKPQQMTRSQYWRLIKLAKAASKILQSQAEKHFAMDKNEVRDEKPVRVDKPHKIGVLETASCA